MQKEQVVQGSGLRGLKGRIRFGKKHTQSKMLIYLKVIFVKIIGCPVCYSLLFNDEFRL